MLRQGGQYDSAARLKDPVPSRQRRALDLATQPMAAWVKAADRASRRLAFQFCTAHLHRWKASAAVAEGFLSGCSDMARRL